MMLFQSINIMEKKHDISFYGKFSKNIGKKNTVQKLFQILDKENLLKNKKFKVKIKKLIPIITFIFF